MQKRSHKINSDLHRALTQYLDQYAEIEANNITRYIPHQQYQHLIVIPAYNEEDSFISRLKNSDLAQQHTLAIIVINQPDNDNDIRPNQTLWNQLIQSHQTINHSNDHHWLKSTGDHLQLLLINRFQKKIPRKQGVGLARKIGSDIACQLINMQCLNSQWIHHTDADVHIPKNYFSALEAQLDEEKNNYQGSHHVTGPSKDHSVTHSAAIYPYQHIRDDNTTPSRSKLNQSTLLKATQHYEKALQYYVDKLQYAGSPYAYHTLGSCMATIIRIKGAELQINARLSDRVPFGTGPAVSKIMEMENPDQQYHYYHPEIFEELKTLLKQFKHLSEKLFTDKEISKTEKKELISQWFTHLSQPLQNALETLKVPLLFNHLERQANSQEHCLNYCNEWLDAFRTLRLVHLLKDDYPNQALTVSLDRSLTTKKSEVEI